MSSVETVIEDKIRSVFEVFSRYRDYEKIAIAYSGGVDSTLVLYLSQRYYGKDKVVAITLDHIFIPRRDIEMAKHMALKLGVEHVVLKTDIPEDVLLNPVNRCYLCKMHVYGEIINYMSKKYTKFVVFDGTNADDLKKFRPGIAAAKRLGVISPLALAGIGKSDVREISRYLGLETWSKPSSPCLATRFPYGYRIDPNVVRKIEEAEDIVRKIADIRVVRVRVHGDVVRIEVGRDERKKLFNESIADAIHEELRKLGFRYIALDLYGYREGSMDEAFTGTSLYREQPSYQ